MSHGPQLFGVKKTFPVACHPLFPVVAGSHWQSGRYSWLQMSGVCRLLSALWKRRKWGLSVTSKFENRLSCFHVLSYWRTWTNLVFVAVVIPKRPQQTQRKIPWPKPRAMSEMVWAKPVFVTQGTCIFWYRHPPCTYTFWCTLLSTPE